MSAHRSTGAMACHRWASARTASRGCTPAAKALIANAKLVIGGKRHLALADGLPRGERKAWPSPIAESIPAILAHRGEPVAVLASGDPYCFGIGAMLSAHVPPEETICVPAPSSLSLACARLGWALDEAATVSLCGRPIETLAPSLAAEAPPARALRRCDHARCGRALSQRARLRALRAARARGFGRPARAHARHDRRVASASTMSRR